MTSERIVYFLILGSTVPAFFGPFLYGVFAPWWREQVTQGLMIGWSALGLFTLWAAAFVIWGDDFPYRDEIRLVVFTLIFCALWWKLIALVRLLWQTWRTIRRQTRDAA